MGFSQTFTLTNMLQKRKEKKKTSLNRAGGNLLFIREIRGGHWDWFKVMGRYKFTITQIITLCNRAELQSITEGIRTGIRGYTRRRRKLEIGKKTERCFSKLEKFTFGDQI